MNTLERRVERLEAGSRESGLVMLVLDRSRPKAECQAVLAKARAAEDEGHRVVVVEILTTKRTGA